MRLEPEPEPRNLTPLWIVLGIVGLIAAVGVVWLLVKPTNANSSEKPAASSKDDEPPASDSQPDAEGEPSTPAKVRVPDEAVANVAMELPTPPPPDAEPVEEPVEQAVEEPKADPAPTAPRRPRSKTPKAAGSTKARSCEETREDAKSAKAAKDWKAVLAATSKRACWTTRTGQRMSHRVEAYRKLERWNDCIKAGKGSGDPVVLNTVSFCSNKLGR